MNYYFYRPQRSWGKVIFSEACVNNSVHGGGVRGCPGGMRGFIRGGMHGFIWGVRGFIRGGLRGFIQWGGMRGFIQQGGRAWFYSGGVCVVLFSGGVCVVLFSRGACVVLFRGGMRGFFSFSGYNEIRSMSGRYTSYWNAFLSFVTFKQCSRLSVWD